MHRNKNTNTRDKVTREEQEEEETKKQTHIIKPSKITNKRKNRRKRKTVYALRKWEAKTNFLLSFEQGKQKKTQKKRVSNKQQKTISIPPIEFLPHIYIYNLSSFIIRRFADPPRLATTSNDFSCDLFFVQKGRKPAADIFQHSEGKKNT